MLAAAEAVLGERPPAIERMTWHDAMNQFGVDKPDLRFGMELVGLTSTFASTEFKAFAGAESVKAFSCRAERQTSVVINSTNSPTMRRASAQRAWVAEGDIGGL